MNNIFGIPVIENINLPEGSAFLIVKDKGVVTQMVEVYNTTHELSKDDVLLDGNDIVHCCIDFNSAANGYIFKGQNKISDKQAVRI